MRFQTELGKLFDKASDCVGEDVGGVEGIQRGNPGSDREGSRQTEIGKTQESNKLLE